MLSILMTALWKNGAQRWPLGNLSQRKPGFAALMANIVGPSFAACQSATSREPS
jgi:hypothetical protein